MAIVVSAGESLIGKVIRNLAVLKFIQQAIPPGDSWYPVFTRYIAQFGDKLSGLGIDPVLIPPSQNDPGVPGRHHKPARDCVTGTVLEVLFDCFGDFTGFVLKSCDRDHHFRNCEKGIAELVLRACKDHLLLTVCCTRGEDPRILEIIVRSRSYL